jgi:hypothetical protein
VRGRARATCSVSSRSERRPLLLTTRHAHPPRRPPLFASVIVAVDDALTTSHDHFQEQVLVHHVAGDRLRVRFSSDDVFEVTLCAEHELGLKLDGGSRKVPRGGGLGARSPAARAGLRAGDEIVAVNDEGVASAYEFEQVAPRPAFVLLLALWSRGVGMAAPFDCERAGGVTSCVVVRCVCHMFKQVRACVVRATASWWRARRRPATARRCGCA